jgi:hypothetical protein
MTFYSLLIRTVKSLLSNRIQVDADDFLAGIAPPAQNPTRSSSAPPETPANTARAPSIAAASMASGETADTAEDFLTPQVRVESPTPAGLYDPDDYHHLARHQVEALLDRRAAPERFDRYEFTPQHFDDLYQSTTSALVHHFTRHPAANASERQDRVKLFRFVTRRYRTMTRRVV